MKHEFLRRLSALALALVMAASLCVTPAWAAETTNPAISTQLIVLGEDDDPKTLTVTGLKEGDTVTWDTDRNVSLNGALTEVKIGRDEEETSVNVSYTGTGLNAKGKVTAHVTRPESSPGANDGFSRNLSPCYVYSRNAFPISVNPNVESVAVGGKVTVTATLTSDDLIDVRDLIDITGGIHFSNGNSSNTVLTQSSESTGKTTVEIVGSARGTDEIIMSSNKDRNCIFDKWNLEVTREVTGTPVTEIYMMEPNSGNISMTIRGTMELKAAVLPSNATDKAVTWTSSNPNIVSVDKVSMGKSNGVDVSIATITAKGEGGPVTITATPNNAPAGVRPATITVTVKESTSDMELELTNPLIDVTTNDTSRVITAKLFGEKHSEATVTWTTNNPAIVDFDGNGLRTITTGVTPATFNGVSASKSEVTIFGKKANNSPVTITAVATFGTDRQAKKVTKTCTVTVIDDKTVLVNSVRLNETTHTMPEDGTFTLTATVSPSNAPVKTVTWSSGNPAVATVDEKTGKVTGVAAGQTTITATAHGGANARCVLTVTPKSETIRLSGGFSSSNPTENTYTYIFGNTGNDRFTVRATLGPTGAADPIHWTSDKESVAAVQGDGTQAVIRAIGPGTATITAVPTNPAGKDREGVTPARITITVSGLTLDSTSLTLAQGRRQELIATACGSAYTGDHSCEWISSDPAVVTVSSANGASVTLTARAPGTALITARKGGYTATCSVTVTEDTAGVIEGISTQPGVAYQVKNLTSSLQSACYAKTGASLAYITNLAVSSTDQGILHDNHFSADDTGAGVGIQDRYYPGTAPQGQRSLSDLSFVPRTTFSGTAEINYTAWSTNNQSVNGVIRIAVNGTGDVMYSTNAGSAVNFLASDFSRIHSNLRSVSFTPPLESAGVLYYKYASSSQPGTRVTSSSVYNRTGTPNLDDVSFVPAAGYQGTVRISYKGTDTSGRTITGVVTVNVTNSSGSGTTPTDISYSVQKENWVTFRPSDFSTACRYALGESLSYVRFTQPPSGEGTLFYNYKGFSDFDGTVASTTNYYYSGTPSLSGVSFVPTTTTPSRVDIPYTGYTTRGNTFTGTVHISLGSGGSSSWVQQNGLRYTVFTGRSVSFNASDFNAACVAALGRNLASIQFNGLPGTSQGTLRVTWGSSSTPSNVTTGTRFFRTGSSTSNLIGNVYFQANSNYTGTFTIPFTGTSESGATFSDVVTIVVTPPVSNEITYSGTTANPIRLYSSHVVSAANGALDGNLSYITFNNLPGTTAGKLYLNYNGFGTGAEVTIGTRYYVSGTPGIDQISFVPRGRCTGQVGVGYTAVSASGQSVSGRVMFSITSTGNSSYFNDMYNHTWAAPSVDYLYQNGVVKGTTATTYGPNRNIKRADFVLMLCRAYQLNGANGYSFADVPTSAYYSQAVATAKRLGIISGTNFRPNEALTRQDAMVMIYNALNASGRNVAPASASVLNQFSDSGSISDYARNAVSALVQLGAVNGSTSGRMNPQSPITRAEAAILLHFIMTM